MSYAHVMDVDDQIEDGEIKRSPPVIKEPSLESLRLVCCNLFLIRFISRYFGTQNRFKDF